MLPYQSGGNPPSNGGGGGGTRGLCYENIQTPPPVPGMGPALKFLRFSVLRAGGHLSRFGSACLLAITLAVGCSGIAQAQSAAGNVVPLTVRTPHGGFNRMVVDVTVCFPGTGRCATIDNIMVDTGSIGLRLQATALPEALRLPAATGPDRQPMGECLRFVSSNAWGKLHRADIRLGGMLAADIAVQVIEQGDTPDRPSSCERSGGQPTANGTLGVGPHPTECGPDCIESPVHPRFFECADGRCVAIPGRIDMAYQLPNPVSRFQNHNNGLVFDLPSTPPGGAQQVTGTLTFGVGTASNNQIGQARVLHLRRGGLFTTLFEGAAYPGSYIDSGTETYAFASDRLPRCDRPSPGYCLSPEQRLEAVTVGADDARIPVAFKVGDYQRMRDRRLGAYDAAATTSHTTQSFVWGLPFFLGRRVVLVTEGQGVPGRSDKGPFYAY